jgi:Gpi18-like mannosyltransferase
MNPIEASVKPGMSRTVLYHELLLYISGASIFIASLAIRYLTFPIVTYDYIRYYSKWFIELQMNPGLSAFNRPFADYAPIYLYILKSLTWIDINSLYSIKAVSIFFDLIIALFGRNLLRYLAAERNGAARNFFEFSVLFTIPTVILNSSVWGQVDSIYGAGIVAATYYIFKDRPGMATLAFSVAFCVKLQSVFFLPVLAGYLLYRRKVTHLAWAPLAFGLSVLPLSVGTGNLAYWFFIYIVQMGEDTRLNVSAPSIFAFFISIPIGTIPMIFLVGIIVAVVNAILVILVASHAAQKHSTELLFLSCLLSVEGLPFFLPHMHERFFYLADIFAVLYTLYRPQRWYVAALTVGASLLSYMPYLSVDIPSLMPIALDLRIPGMLMATSLFLVIVLVAVELRSGLRTRPQLATE